MAVDDDFDPRPVQGYEDRSIFLARLRAWEDRAPYRRRHERLVGVDRTQSTGRSGRSGYEFSSGGTLFAPQPRLYGK
jgi:hypothetical protein